MAKTKLPRLISQRIYILAGLTLLLSLSLSIPPNPAAASPDEVKWSRVDIPTEGKAGNWVLADGSDIKHLTMSADGTLYAYGKDLSYTLYKSTDGGYSWSHIGNVTDDIVDIAIAPTNADFIYYATTADVYRSTDGGKIFTRLPANPGGAGSNNIEITSIDVTSPDGNIIGIGIRDTDASEFGGVYTLDEEGGLSNWVDTNIGSYDAYAGGFLPRFCR
ncbi:WD40/YVTN/BNR-like repeat-containing protein [Chloroflexota bacterium]